MLGSARFDLSIYRAPVGLACLRALARRREIMAKSQKKSSKEIRKPKAEKPKKQNASNPSQKAGVLPGLENMKR
jgi:hypothetical protein